MVPLGWGHSPSLRNNTQAGDSQSCRRGIPAWGTCSIMKPYDPDGDGDWRASSKEELLVKIAEAGKRWLVAS